MKSLKKLSQHPTVKILIFTDHDSGRDVEMLLPLRFFAERVLNCEVEQAFHYDIHKIYRYKPQLVVLPNTIGSHEYYLIAKFSAKQNIPVFALDSEGNFRTDGSYNHWGYNILNTYFQEFVCCWSNRTRDYLQKQEPKSQNKIITSGGLGFDRFKIYDFKFKEDYLRENDKVEYKYIITYAAWAFGKMDYQKGQESLVGYFKGDESKLSTVEPQRKAIEKILKEVIEKNEDVLFVLKKHPQERRPTEKINCLNEINELGIYDNVIIEGESAKTDDLISISDLWLTFESTTAIEAWLRDKETILLRTNSEFTKTIEDKELDTSQCIADSYSKLQEYIDEYKAVNRIQSFHLNVKQKTRERVITNSLGFADGLNHIRAGYYLKRTIDNADFSKIKYHIRLKSFIIYALTVVGVFFYNRKLYSILPKAKKFLWVFEQYKLVRLKKDFESYSVFLERFYKKNRIIEKFKQGVLFKEIDGINGETI